MTTASRLSRCALAVAALLLVPVGTAAAAPSRAPVYVANDGDGRVDVHDVGTGAVRTIATAYDSDDDTAAGDVDGDAREDLVVANDADFNDDTGRIDIHHGNGQTTDFFVIGFDGGSDEVAVGNVLGDSKAEIVVADSFHGFVNIYDAGGERLDGFGSGFDGDDAIALADVDRDGLDDIVIANGGEGGRVDVIAGDGDPVRTLDSAFDGDDQLAAGDVTGDGADDLVVGNAGENGRLDVINLVTGTSAGKNTAFDADDALAVGDVRGDGAEEIVVANTEGDGRVDVFDGRITSLPGFDSAYNSGDDLTVGAFGSGDLDGDGIPDKVELNGIDDPEFKDAGLSPCRKDVLVDLDYMFQAATATDPQISHKPRAAALTLVKDAFANAPVDGVADCPYADVSDDDGINLFIHPITNADRVPYDAVINLPGDFTTLKANHFDPKLEAYVHFNVWGSLYQKQTETAPTTSAGLANFSADGQDFIITLGGFPNFGGKIGQASDFMHELGHSLGLDHGGDTKLNCKPNYLSVMNYAFGLGGLIDDDGKLDPTIDYSRSDAFETVRESGPVESKGVGGGSVKTPDGKDVVFQTRWYDDAGIQRFGRIGGRLDFNDDKDFADSGPINLNDGGQCESPSAADVMEPFDDWAALNRGLVPKDAAAAPPVEITAEQHALDEATWDQSHFPDETVAVMPPKPGTYGAVLGVASDAQFVYATHSYRTTTNPAQGIGNGTLVMLDRKTLKAVAQLPVGTGPKAVAVNPVTKRAYVVNLGASSYSVSVVDTAARKVIAEIPMGQGPVDIAVNTKLNRVYVASTFEEKIHVIDGKTNTKLPSIAIGPGPTGLAVDEERNAVYVAMTKRGVGITPTTALGTILDNGVTKPQVLPRIDLGPQEGVQPVDVAVDPVADRIYVAGLGGGGVTPQVIALDRTTRAELARIPVPGPARALSVNPDAGLVTVATDRGAFVIDGARLELVRHMEGGVLFSTDNPAGAGRQFYSGDFLSGELRRWSYGSGVEK